MFNGVEIENWLMLLAFADGYPSRNEATELPDTASLLFWPFADVNSLSNQKEPLLAPGRKLSMPILRKSPPNFIVCVPKKREYAALALVDFQSICVGLIAPRVRLASAS